MSGTQLRWLSSLLMRPSLKSDLVSFKLDIISFLRSLSFGGLLGCGVAYLVFLSYPNLFVGHVRVEAVVVFGSLLGACLHRLIDRCLVKGILSPFGRFLEYYGKLVQLTVQKRTELMDDDRYKELKYELDINYFLGPAAQLRTHKRVSPAKTKLIRK